MPSETLADIVAEYRRDYEDMKAKRLYLPTAEYLRRLLDRIEAAAMRETVGNMAAMREALVKCREIALQWEADEAAGVAGTTDKPESRSAAEAVIDMEFEINAALAEPPRQCDVGTPKEQADRHRELCLKHGGCSTCPRNKKEWSFKDCILEWAQEPYEKGGEK